ncbi:hypothetical protein [Kribbella albertanoniae]|uniref:Recombinase family protein n=1 Tax=Kribbella albertanoniae TaxID=1266829 RepID=A0A4R4QCL0_9ACTN|nr:hypothetical protein [Kribbella albertanoniae]TDC33157.1 hypothetical protein E1261_06615 [Kribbella albertanoniae]
MENNERITLAVGTRAVCGYLRKAFLMTSSEVDELRRSILDCAASQELTVDAIYEEELDRASDQLVECIGALIGADQPVLIIPSLLHFAGFGNPLEVRRDFQTQGIHVLVAQDSRPRS